MNNIYGYIRVSTISQREDRQWAALEEFDIPRENVFVDKQSGKDFQRPMYKKLLWKLKRNDLLYIKRMSVRGAMYKLIEKGIDKETAQSVLDEFEIDPVEQLTELIGRKYADKLEDEKDRRRTVAALQRLGYSWPDIKAALMEFEE